MPATPRSERRTQNRAIEATLLRENLAARGYADAHIASVLSDMDADLSALEPRHDKTRALKQAMMQELLTGRTRLVCPPCASS